MINKGDTIYYYDEKYPECGVKHFEIKEVEITKIGEYEWISGIISSWNISIEKNDVSNDEYGHYYSLYQSTSNKDIYYHDMANYTNRSLVLSTNKDKIRNKCIEECKYFKESLTKRLKLIDKILEDNNDNNKNN